MKLKKLLRHYILPHEHNNFRAKLLHNSSLLVLTFILLVVGISSTALHRHHPEVLGISYSISSDELLAITNKDRADNNLSPLKINSQLTQAAQEKAADMFAKNYWAHFAPDGSTSPWMFIKDSGYQYVYAGENLAKGFTTANDVVTAWMNSPSHRENMLSKNYSDIGFAIVPGTLQGEDTVLVVEMFGSTDVPVTAAVPEVNAVDDSAQPVLKPQAALPTNAPVQQNAPAVIPVNGKSNVIKTALPSTSYVTKPLIDIKSLSTNIIFIIFAIILTVLVADLLYVERRKNSAVCGAQYRSHYDYRIILDYCIT